jgi:hypothetical protein
MVTLWLQFSRYAGIRSANLWADRWVLLSVTSSAREECSSASEWSLNHNIKSVPLVLTGNTLQKPRPLVPEQVALKDRSDPLISSLFELQPC